MPQNLPSKKERLKVFKRMQEDPCLYLTKVLGDGYWSKQAEIIRAVFKHRKVTVKACHAPGKSYIAARIVLAWLYLHLTSTVCLTTAPTFRQVKKVIWKEINKAFKKSKVPLDGKILQTELNIEPDQYAMGFSSKDPDHVSGIHAENLLAVLDEAAGIQDDTIEAIDGILSSLRNHLLMIGNPTNPDGVFARSFKSDLYYKISITAFDTPNFTYNDIKTPEQLKAMSYEEVLALPIVAPYLTNPLWVWERIHEWGIDSIPFQSRVMAEFPDEGEYTLIKFKWLDAASDKEFTDEEWEKRRLIKSMGIDVARGGSDTTVFTMMDWRKHTGYDYYNGKDTMEVVGRAIRLFDEYGMDKARDVIVIDDIGVGGGVTDRLSELGYNVIAFNGAAKDMVEDETMFWNNRAQWYWNLRKAFSEGELTLIDAKKYLSHLSAMEIKPRSSGHLLCLSKEDIKKKIGESPDWADSYLYAFIGIAFYGIANYDVDDGEDAHDTVAGNLLDQQF